jgi:hypothetical protein
VHHLLYTGTTVNDFAYSHCKLVHCGWLCIAIKQQVMLNFRSGDNNKVRGGTFSLSWGGLTTAALPWNIAAADMEVAVHAISGETEVIDDASLLLFLPLLLPTLLFILLQVVLLLALPDQSTLHCVMCYCQKPTSYVIINLLTCFCMYICTCILMLLQQHRWA